MLTRPPSPADQAKRRARNRRYEARQRAGQLVLRARLGPNQINRLEADEWLRRGRPAHSRREIEIALQAWIDASLK
jgi:hypothetical protein